MEGTYPSAQHKVRAQQMSDAVVIIFTQLVAALHSYWEGDMQSLGVAHELSNF